MKKALRKSVVGVSVTYSNGDYSNNLTGCNIELEYVSNCFCLSIDLTRNIRVRNKQENCFYDRYELAKQRLKLSSVQINILTTRYCRDWRPPPRGFLMRSGNSDWPSERKGLSSTFLLKPQCSRGSTIVHVLSMV